MSLTSLAQNSALRLAVRPTGQGPPGGTPPPKSPPATPPPDGGTGAAPAVTASGPLAQLVTYIPTETIAVYVVVSTALGEVVAPPGKRLDQADFGAHWLVFWVVLVATGLLAVGLSARAQKEAGGGEWQVPWFDVLAATAAFAVWALSLPGTPLRALAGYDAGTWSSVILLVGTTVIATSAYVFGRTVSWEKRPTSS